MARSPSSLKSWLLMEGTPARMPPAETVAVAAGPPDVAVVALLDGPVEHVGVPFDPADAFFRRLDGEELFDRVEVPERALGQ